MFDWTQYTGNFGWLPKRTIFLTRHGSHAYGTSLPTSDMDIRGIAVAPLHYYLGISEVFEQAVQNQPVDLTIFDIRKFLKLAADANPNAGQSRPAHTERPTGAEPEITPQSWCTLVRCHTKIQTMTSCVL